ncbi:MAG: CHAD domain-containing protein [Pseudomonadota bacterium]|uniref:CHAD domain-containing protein n=1 Tax=Gallaecimonas pentaromativorans TaxID=584787 RepID=UPI00067F6637|nr:CHAD domain-containing protein [Gallaecimonas pentaromativorans]MED5523921.1 CHAD domain-containing protein [Pseudomonadota bacterium]
MASKNKGLERLDPIAAELLAALDGGSVHQCRKVAKKADAWAKACRCKPLAKAAKGLKKQLGAARNRQVLHYWHQQLALAPLAEPKMPVPDPSALAAAIKKAPPLEADALLSAYSRAFCKGRAQYRACRGKHPKSEPLHRLRSTIKQLEAYSEWLGAAQTAKVLNGLGQQLGDDHDLSLIDHKIARQRRRAAHPALLAALGAFFTAYGENRDGR